MQNWLIACSILALLFNGDWAFGQQSAPTAGDSHKYRTIFTVVGGGGGFALGGVGGLAAFDDATNSDRKVWTTAAFSAVGGAVGGYFLGRALDRRTKKTKVAWVPEEIKRGFVSSQWSNLRFNGPSQPSGRSPTCNTRVITTKENLSLAETIRLWQPDWSCSVQPTKDVVETELKP